MWTGLLRRVALVAFATGLVGSGAVTACSNEKPADTKSSTATVSPTEKFM